ncbi:MAG TPA: efflux RND transporter permease subunit [Gemmatimonadales bacterium]|nr:efflux RND transporter permease subunit [Gemmatimonadales bacterium]
MMRWIVASSLRFRYLVIAGAAALVFFGQSRLRHMAVDVFPEFAPPKVEIQTEGQGMSSAEVEDLITNPMELVLSGTPELDVMRSRSVNGLSQIVLQFKRGTDILHARQMVQERLNLAVMNLPAAAATPPVMLQPLSATSRVMKIGLSSQQYNLMDLSMIAYWTIKFRLLQVPGVANVPMWGERIKMFTIQVDPEKARQHRVSLEQIHEVTSETLDMGLLPYSVSAKTQTEGFIDTPNQRLPMQHVAPIIEPEDVERIIVQTANGRTVRLGDVANIRWDTWPLVGDAVINDGPGLMLIVEKLPWANTLQVTQGVDAAIEELRRGLPGVEIDSKIFRPATYIELSIKNLTNALLLGCLLVVGVLVFFLYDWRAAVISVVAIPLSLMAAMMVLYVRDATINVMVLAGLVISVGVVVDDAIIDIENITRRLRQYRKEGTSRSIGRIILDGSLEVRSAIIYATLIDVTALLPVFFMQGLSGAFFRPLAISYALAVLASLVVALTVTPAMGLLLLRNAPLTEHGSPLARWLQTRYQALLARIVRVPRTAYAMVVLVVAAGIFVVPRLGQELLPSFKERDFLMHWLNKPGSSHPEMYRITAAASKELRSIPGVRNFGAHIGRALTGDEPYGINFTENWISVDPKVDYDATLAAIHETVEGYPGVYRDVQTYLKERIREVLTGGGHAIIVRMFGPELSTLRAAADSVKAALEGIDGLADLHVQLQTEIPFVEVKVNVEAANRYGLSPGEVLRSANRIMTGAEVSDIHRDGWVYDVQVWSIPEARQNLTNVREMLIDTPDGGHVRLADVASVTVKPTANMIQRENAARRLDVQASAKGRDLGSVVADVEKRLQTVRLPLGYHAELQGEWKERQAASKTLMFLAIFAAIGILFLLETSFKSWRLGILSFVTLPSALVGGALAIYFSTGVVSLGSLVGFLTILGIAARNGIMMINHFQHLERFEGETFGPALVLRGARERLSPILMTTLATGLALVPLVVAGSIPGHEIEHPLAIVVLGGLITSTLLNLFIVPSLYLRFGKNAATTA